MRPLESTTLPGKEHGELSGKHMVCGVTCKRKFDTPRKQFFKKQQGIIGRLYFDIMLTNVRVGDTVRVLGDIANGRCVYAFGWGRVKHIRFDWPSGCAEISVKVLDTTVLVWPAEVRRWLSWRSPLKLVVACGWEEQLKAHDSLLDLTLGQTSTKDSGVAAKKKALLATLKAVAAAVETIGLEVTEEL